METMREGISQFPIFGHGLWAVLAVVLIAVVIAAVLEQFRQKPKPREPKPEPIPETRNSLEISSSRRVYHLTGQIGTGDLCDVHRAESDGKVYTLKINRHAEGEELLRKELSVLKSLHEVQKNENYLAYLPEPVETFSHQNQRVNVFAHRDGQYSAEQILNRYHHGVDVKHLGWMFNRVWEVLGFIHQQGWVHGAVLPPHLLFHPESHGLQLVGWIHAEKTKQILKVVPEQFKAWYPPECQKKLPVTPSVDVYLAAKSLIYLAGGDPIANIMPETLPAPVQRFIKGCLLESPRMRSQDAWQVRKEFGEILEGLFGPPKFHPFEMS